MRSVIVFVTAACALFMQKLHEYDNNNFSTTKGRGNRIDFLPGFATPGKGTGTREESDYEKMGLQLRSYPFPLDSFPDFSFLQSDCFRDDHREGPEGVKWEQGFTRLLAGKVGFHLLE